MCKAAPKHRGRSKSEGENEPLPGIDDDA